MKVLCEYFSVPCFAPLLLFVVDHHHQNQPEKLRNFLLVVVVVVWAMRRRRRGEKRKILGDGVVGVVLDSDPFRNSSWFCAPFLS